MRRPRHASTSLLSAAFNRDVERHAAKQAEACFHQPLKIRRPSAATIGCADHDAERRPEEPAEPCLHQPLERSAQQERRAPL